MAARPTDTPAFLRPSDLIDPRTGKELPPMLSTQQAAKLLDRHENTILLECAAGRLPVREGHKKGEPWEILTAPLLRQLGLLREAS